MNDRERLNYIANRVRNIRWPLDCDVVIEIINEEGCSYIEKFYDRGRGQTDLEVFIRGIDECAKVHPI